MYRHIGIISVVVLVVAGCTNRKPTSTSPAPERVASTQADSKEAYVRCRGTIKSYSRDALHEDYTDGGFATFAGTEILITEPSDWRSTVLMVYSLPDEDVGILKQTGTSVSFKIQRKFLVHEYPSADGSGSTTQHDAFASALEDLRVDDERTRK